MRFGVAQGRRTCADYDAIAHVYMHATDIGTPCLDSSTPGADLRAVNVCASAERSPHAYIYADRPAGFDHVENI